ncbi:hydroxypyruvate isomerase family protein [Usitatibacter palustris]|uniref:Hydroxypyruvate isomerase n=1 Tax=Usitatibacter palustris TaxID=2732487 RepID=A0A6M4HC97_9PROT|nr:TIM barrel protein [Usitatibacter palustris]QJR16213.1 Hydroxypyruvate isomerase [Usitatibacter palustris]
MPRFAANLGFLFTEHDFLERFGAARRAGFAAVEFASPYDHPAQRVAERLEEHGLACALFNLPMGDRAKGDFGLACRPERIAEFRSGVARAIEYALALRCPRMNCVAGKQLPGEDAAVLRATLIDNITYAATELARAELELVVEPINSIDAPGFFLTRCSEGAALIAEVNAPNLALQCDLYHVAMMRDDPAATLDSLKSVIRHVQFADAPGRNEPGCGRLDFAALFAQLDRLGYAGWTSAEYRPSKRTEDTLVWMK